MVGFRTVFAVVLISTSAQAQNTTVTRSSDYTKSAALCVGKMHGSVAEGLKALEGTKTRHQAEICKLLPGAQQEDCMAAVPRDQRDKDLALQATPEGWKPGPRVEPLDGGGGGARASQHHRLCQERWGSNYEMREYCDREQNSAKWRGGY